MKFKFVFLPLTFVTATAAAAQYIPGLEVPQSTADGFEQMLATACPLAVIGEELAGFTKDHPQETAISVIPALPKELASYVSNGPTARIMKIPTPGDDLFAIYDAPAQLCTVIAVTDPAPIETQLIEPLSSSGYWPKIDNPGDGFDHGFIYDFAGLAKLEVRFSLPTENGQPVIATVSPSDRPTK